jgi:hypothetical protein
MRRLRLRVVHMRPLELAGMSDGWLLSHVSMPERTLAKLKGEGTTRAESLIERYSMMRCAALLELARREDDY